MKNDSTYLVSLYKGMAQHGKQGYSKKVKVLQSEISVSWVKISDVLKGKDTSDKFKL